MRFGDVGVVNFAVNVPDLGVGGIQKRKGCGWKMNYWLLRRMLVVPPILPIF